MTTNQKTQENRQEHKGGNPLLGVGVALAIAAAIGVILAPKESKDVLKKEVMDRAHEIAKNFKKSRAEVKAMVEDAFGDASDELEKNYIQIRGQILASIEEWKEKAELTQENYNNIVKDSIQQFAKGKKWTNETVSKLQKNLEKEWKDIKA